MGKYYPLQRHLSRVTNTRKLTLTFHQIEQIINNTLPASASHYRQWWANDRKHVHAVAWLDAGWSLDTVDLSRRTATFTQ